MDLILFQKLRGNNLRVTLEQIKNVGIEIGNMLLPIVNDFLKVVRGVVTWFKNLSSEGKKLTLIFAGFMAALGPALIGLGTLAVILGSISLPILGVIAAIALLGAAILYIWDNWQAITERISDWSWWRNMLIDLAKFGITTLTWTFSGIVALWNKLMMAIGQEGSMIADPFIDIKNALDALKAPTKEYEHQFKSFSGTIVSYADKIKNALSGMSSGGGGVSSSDVGNRNNIQPLTRKGATAPTIPGAPDLKTIPTVIDNATKSVFKLGDAMQNTLNTAFADFATTLGNVFSGESGVQGFFNNLLLIVADFADQFGKALIGAGVAALAFENLMINPIAAIAAGVALVATATIAKNLLKKGPGMESGGIVPSGFPNDSYNAKLTSGEMVIPPHKLPNMMGGGNLKLSFPMRQLVIELDRERDAMKRSGYN